MPEKDVIERAPHTFLLPLPLLALGFNGFALPHSFSMNFGA